MIEIGGKPILWHIMKYYSSFGFNEFIICCGYKQHVIKEWFANYYLHNSDITLDFTKGNEMTVHNNVAEPWKVTMIDTGLNTMTGGRIKRIQPYVGNEPFMLTYGDGVSNVDLNALVRFHQEHGKIATMTAVNVGQQFGVLEIDKENRRLSLGHKQLEENPWDVFETVFTVGSVHEGTIIEMLDKGAVVALPYGVEGFATPKHLVKEDGSQAQMDEKLEFKVIEFNKDAKRIILSHSRIFEDVAKAEERAEKKAASNAKKSSKREETPAIQNQAASTTLGDIDALAALKEQLEGKK